MGISPKSVRMQFWDARQFWWKWVDTVQMLHIVDMLQMHQMLSMIHMKSMKIYENSTKISENL